MYMRHTLDMNAQIMPCKVSIFFFNENIFALFIMAVRCNTKAWSTWEVRTFLNERLQF